jgi:hypothetical protein
MSEGGKPGKTAKVVVLSVTVDTLTLGLKDQRDADYFKVGEEFVAQFMPTPDDK